MSRGKQQFIIFAFGFVLSAILSISGFYIYNNLVSGKIKGLNEQTEEQVKVSVVVAAQKIEKGDELLPEFFTLEERFLSEVPANSILDINTLQGKRAAAIIDPNLVITDSMVVSTEELYKPDERLKDYTLQGYLVAGMVKEGDWIDVEMVRENGDTFTVLSKKQVKRLLDDKAIIQVTALERQYINYALAEQSAGLGHIESVLYLDESQPASTVNYVPANLKATPTPLPEPTPTPQNTGIVGGGARER